MMMMMRSHACVAVLFCVVSTLFVHGAPGVRRVSRDLDKIDGLRARLLRLQNQINALEDNDGNDAREVPGREQGPRTGADDVSAEEDVSSLRAYDEARVTSQKQRDVQKLARKLDEDRESDLRGIANTLSQLLRESPDDRQFPETSNSDGDYLGASYNGRGTKKSSRRPQGESQREKVPAAAAAEMGREEEEEDDLNVEIDDQHLQRIYSMLLRMYHDQQDDDTGSVAETTRAQEDTPIYVPDSSDSRSRHSIPLVHVDEGSFGSFADDSQARSRSTLPRARHPEMRGQVLRAIEGKLLRDVQDAQDNGISIGDIIGDIESKARTQVKRERLREIETQLNDLADSR